MRQNGIERVYIEPCRDSPREAATVWEAIMIEYQQSILLLVRSVRSLAALSVVSLAACAGQGGTEAAGGGLGEKLNVAMVDDASDATTLDARPYSRYFALGDSFSAGTGSVTGAVTCGQSNQAWAYQLQPALNSSTGTPAVVMQACSGATTQDVNASQLPTVLAAADRNSSLITITIGGNDTKISDELQACAAGDCTPNESRVNNTIDTVVAPRLLETFNALRAAAPSAVIVAVGYPHLVAPSTNTACDATTTGSLVDGNERDMIRRAIDRMNTTIANAATSAGIVSVTKEVVAEFEGQEACSGSRSFINTVDDPVYYEAMYHPNALGEVAYANAVLAGLTKRVQSGPNVTVPPTAAVAPAPVSAAPAPVSALPATALPAAAPAPAPAAAPLPAAPVRSVPAPAPTPAPAVGAPPPPAPGATPVPGKPVPGATPAPGAMPASGAAGKPMPEPGDEDAESADEAGKKSADEADAESTDEADSDTASASNDADSAETDTAAQAGDGSDAESGAEADPESGDEDDPESDAYRAAHNR
jgi:lysophospholipase L1-like esterase